MTDLRDQIKQIARERQREEIGAWVIVAGVVLILGSAAGAALAALASWICDRLFGA